MRRSWLGAGGADNRTSHISSGLVEGRRGDSVRDVSTISYPSSLCLPTFPYASLVEVGIPPPEVQYLYQSRLYVRFFIIAFCWPL